MNKFKALGKKVTQPNKPHKNILEVFPNKAKNLFLIPLLCNEFTSLGPENSQPDFATFEIIYVPKNKIVESKSLKIYLQSYRNTVSFYEDTVNNIFNDLWTVTDPSFMRIIASFNTRGGIGIKPLVQKFSEQISETEHQEIWELIESWDSGK